MPKVGNTQRDKAAGQTIRDNREDRRVIGSGGRLKAWGRDTGYMLIQAACVFRHTEWIAMLEVEALLGNKAKIKPARALNF